jgi:hypothetical protein
MNIIDDGRWDASEISPPPPTSTAPPHQQGDGSANHNKQTTITDKEAPPIPLSAPLRATVPGEVKADANDKAGDITPKQDNPGKSFWEFTLTDVIIAAFTGLIFIVGALQWDALRDQVRKLKESIDIAERALIATEPAFLFNHGLAMNSITGVDGKIKGWRFIFNWKNAGTTPARRVLMHTSLHVTDVPFDPANPDPDDPDLGGLPVEFDYPDTYGFREPTGQVAVSIGPQGEMAGNPKVVETAELLLAYRRRRRIFIYGWTTYNDIFPNTPRHRTEFCFDVIVVANPESEIAGISTFLMVAYGPHNGAETECYRKADETAREVPFGKDAWPLPH